MQSEPKARGPPALERLAALEHDQWIAWSKDIASKEKLSPARVKRWKRFWVPYAKLSDDVKEHDRKWARKALKAMRGSPRERPVCPRCRKTRLYCYRCDAKPKPAGKRR